MTLTSYEQFKNKISYRIHNITGWNLSDSRKITKDLVDAVKDQGDWNKELDIGSYNVSAYNTLREFLDYLTHSSFGISRRDINNLIRKFKSTTAIEALTGFLELRSESFLQYRKSLWQRTRTKISNAPSVIRNSAIASFNRLTSQTKITLSDLRKKLSQVSTPMKIIYTIMTSIGLIGSIAVDNEAVVGGLPLGGMGIDSPTSIQEIEVAHSNKIIKFRAVGSIFLAHQIGGKDTISIKGKLTGPLRMYWLAAIWILSLISQGKLEDITNFQENNEDSIINAIRSGIGSTMRLNRLPISNTHSIETQRPKYEKHFTFPVITQHEIITNAYIETFSFEEKISNYRDVITYDLLLRTYEEPEEFIADAQHSLYRQAKGSTKSQQILKYAINFTYRMLKWAKEFYYVETNAWKTDNYYDVDAIDMGTAFTISLMGVSQ